MAVARYRLRAAGIIALSACVVTLVAGCTTATHVAARRDLASAAPIPTSALSLPVDWVAKENLKPGDSTWSQSSPHASGDVAGWLDHVSVLPGQSLSLYVSTTASQWRATVFRMGWYRGSLARRVWQSSWQKAVVQPPAHTVAPTNTDITDWSVSLSLDTTQWLPGSYLVRLDSSDDARSFVPVTIRTADNHGLQVLLNAVTTWQAYNAWGGHSLYHGSGGEGDFAGRARAVSYNRPYDFGQGSADFIGNELPAVALAERLGLHLGYATDVDLDLDPHLLDGAASMLSLGHDEYWSSAMRAEATAARDSGTNLAFLGANAIFRHIRFSANALGPDRLQIDYKRANEDPLLHTDPAEVTSDWREPPVPRPENTLTGTFYQCNPVLADMVVTDANVWPYAGSGAHSGQALRGLIGSEYDEVVASATTPHPIQVLTHSPVRCRNLLDHSDSAYYTTKSGAAVFDSGTSSWVCAIINRCSEGRGDPTAANVVRYVTTQILKAFASPRAGLAHPATDNTAQLVAAPVVVATSTPAPQHRPSPAPQPSVHPSASPHAPPASPSPSTVRSTPTPSPVVSQSPNAKVDPAAMS